MKRYQKILIPLLLLCIAVISFVVVYLIYLSTKFNENLSIVSYPIININSYPVPVSYFNFNDDFYKKYGTQQVVPASYPNQDINLTKYFNFRYDYKNISSITFFLVDSSKFKSSKELYERMYVDFSPTGSFIQYRETNFGGYTLSMALMDVPYGAGVYMLDGAIKNNSKGYYFQILLGSSFESKLTDKDVNDLFNFTYNRTPKQYLDILQNLIIENLSEVYFRPYSNSFPKEYIDDLKKANNNKFPTTF